MIETQHKQVPWRWVVLITLPSFATTLAEGLSSSFLTFTLRKFFDNPATIAFISSLNVFFNVAVGVVVMYVSDHVWFRSGRRKPFVITAWILMIACSIFVPLVRNVYVLVPLVVVWLALADMSMPFGILQQEIIPPQQRGRASGIAQFIGYAYLLFVYTIMLGRFDDQEFQPWFVITGDRAAFWTSALILAITTVFVAFYVRERKPVQALTSQKVSLANFFTSVFTDKTLWPIYLLSFSRTFLAIGLGTMGTLLFTEQWGYTKQEMGTNIAIGGLINIPLTLVVGYFADKFDRIKLYTYSICGNLLMTIAYYCFVQFFLPDHRPLLWQIILFGEIGALIGLLSSTVAGPMAYDYIPRDKMGTVAAGSGIIGSLTRLLMLNGVSLWVTFYSKRFCPPGQLDYFSGYLMMIAMGMVGVGISLLFVGMVRRGVIKPYGRMNIGAVEQAPAP
ncbi:MAG: MFS transporter [bacterium]|nr:MFS transporter [bacterium]